MLGQTFLKLLDLAQQKNKKKKEGERERKKWKKLQHLFLS